MLTTSDVGSNTGAWGCRMTKCHGVVVPWGSGVPLVLLGQAGVLHDTKRIRECIRRGANNGPEP